MHNVIEEGLFAELLSGVDQREAKEQSDLSLLTAEQIGELAVRALRIEAAVTPKPGLVDRENSGAHDDMDYPLFLASSAALLPCFIACAKAGIDGYKKNPAQLVPILRRIGRCGETAMYAATKGVNTHKGAIFSMGILCCALGMLSTRGAKGKVAAVRMRKIRLEAEAGTNAESRAASVQSTAAARNAAAETNAESKAAAVRNTAAYLAETELQALCAALSAALLRQDTAAATHGRKAREHAACGGVRAEAASGFATAFQVGLPVLRDALCEGLPQETALVKTLLALIARTEDSNTAYRGGAGGLAFMQKTAEEILRKSDWNSEESLDMVREFDRTCIERHLSPGGSADLLAFSAMLLMIFDEVSL